MAQEALIESHVRGLRWRDFITVILCTGSIVGTVMGVYFAIKGDLRELRQDRSSDERVIELRLSTMEANLKALEVQVETIRTDIFINRRNLENK